MSRLVVTAPSLSKRLCRPVHTQLHGARLFSANSDRHRKGQPVGVEAALLSESDASFKPQRTLFEKEFSLAGRVAIVTGGQRGLGLEMAATLAEAGAVVYCLDLPKQPEKVFNTTQKYLSKLELARGARLEYASVDVTKRDSVWNIVEKIAKKEGRMDVCVAAAGVMGNYPALEYAPEKLQRVLDINLNGVYYTAQAAGRQMIHFGTPGSIIMLSSIAGNVAFGDEHCSVYGISKAAVKHLGQYLACELGPNQIRVNTISPGFIYSPMTQAFFDEDPQIEKKWSNQNPLGRLGRPDELRGVVSWLASDASSFCTGSDILVTGGHHAW